MRESEPTPIGVRGEQRRRRPRVRKNRPLPEGRCMVLEVLADKTLEDEMIPYRISEKGELNYSRVHKEVKILERKGFVKSKKVGDAPRGDMNAYTLTLRGLVAALTVNPHLWRKKIDNIASKQARLLPLVFGKWDCLARPGIRELLLVRLEDAFWMNFWSLLIEGVGKSDRRIISDEKFRLQILICVLDGLVDATCVGTKEQRKEWVEAISSDPELSKLVRKLLRDRTLGSKESASAYEAMVRAIEQKDPKLYPAMRRIGEHRKWHKELETLVVALERTALSKL